MRKIKNINIILIITFIVIVLIASVVIFRYQTVSKKETQDTTTTTSTTNQSNGSNLEGFDFNDKSGGAIKNQHYLKNISFGKHDGYERVTIELENNSSGIPSYIASLMDNKISLLNDNKGQVVSNKLGVWRIETSLIDTKDYKFGDDGNAQKVYLGQNEISTEGEVINKIIIFYPNDDSNIKVLIGLNKKSQYKVFTLKSSDRIVIDVKK